MSILKTYINKGLPDQLTAYDWLKSFALITMIVDHVGAYLYPEVSELRAIGRLSMPVWLFLVGYARSRDLGPAIWIGAGLLVALDLTLGQGLFSMNILITIILARLSLDFLAHIYLKGSDQAVFVTLFLAAFVIPTSFLFEYGTHAFLFALFGYLVRHRQDHDLSNTHLIVFAGAMTLAIMGMQLVNFSFSFAEQVFVSLSILAISLYLIAFPPQKAGMNKRILGQSVLKLMGRRSLELYVLHLFILKIWALYKFPESYNLWNFSLF